MSKELSVFNDILLLHLRPWKVQFSDPKYKQLTHEIKKVTYRFQPLYENAFIKPVSDKRKYYHTLITTEAIAFLNSINTEIETALNNNERKYWVTNALNKILKSKIKDVRTIIEQKNFQLTSISVTNDDAYIIQYLKYQLIRLYLEVQDSYRDVIADEPLTLDDILSNLFSDPPFEKQIIVPEVKKLTPENTTTVLTPKPAPSKFVQHNHEIRDLEEDVLLYHEIVNKPEALGRVEEILFEDKYIDQDLKFIKGKGKQLVIAAVTHILKQRKFFKEKTFHGGKKITVTDLHIQRFISHRYLIKVDQQYRRFKNQDALLTFLDENLWIKTLPSS